MSRTHIKPSRISESIRIALIGTTALACSAMPLSVSIAQENEAAEESDVERIAIVGSRSAPRSVSDSPVPVDIIGGEEFQKQGNTDMNSMLSSVVPSYNVNAQPINDASTLVRPANLRGLPPDNTLILVNGKRRHRAAVITFLGGGISDGAQGPDVSVIPSLALKQVEVLRDGAAAQYGSDAIAGVINFALKDDDQGGAMEARYGQTYHGDGETITVAGNIGMPFTSDGFVNLTGEYKEADPTDRSVQRTDAQALIDAGNTDVANPAQIWGSPEIQEEFKLFANMGVQLDESREFYLTGNWARREVEGGFYFRNPTTRSGVYSGDSGETLLVGDLTPDDANTCPTVSIGTNGLPDPDALAQIVNDPNCFSFYEMFPGGFTPRFGGKMEDRSLSFGVRGEWDNEITYDFSAYLGYNEINFRIRNTVNPSLGPDTPISFEPGSYIQSDMNFNADFTKDFEIDWLEYPLHAAWGIEHRTEEFEIKPGDAKSFEIGPLTEQGFTIGSNGFNGFKPDDAGEWQRSNWAGYVDVEAEFTDNFLLGVALRYEDFQDFGSTTNGKLTAQYRFNEMIAIRGAASTGFRAPTVGQSNVRNVSTAFSNGELRDEATLPPTNPISVSKGGKALEPEESVSMSFGVVFEWEDLFVTIDYFDIDVDDRIAQTDVIELTDQDRADLLAQGILDARNFSSVRYFTNDFDTTTQGIDLVANYSMDMFGGSTDFALAFNWTSTEVDNASDNISATRIKLLENNLPATRGSFTTTHENGDWSGLFRVNYYGSYFEDHLESGGDLPIHAGSEITLDMEVAYNISDSYTVAIGAQNLLDEYPDEHPWQGEAGSRYPTTSPFGINGGFYYARFNYNF